MKSFRVKLILLQLLSSYAFSHSLQIDESKLSFEDLNNSFITTKRTDLKFKYASAYLKKAKLQRINIHIAKGYYLLANLQYHLDDKMSIRLLDSVIKYSENNYTDPFFPAAAYCDKAIFLVKQRQYLEAVKNYNRAENYASRSNTDYYYVIRASIAITKSENLGEAHQALKLYQECFRYYQKKEVRLRQHAYNYQCTLFGLADVFKTLKMTDSCSYYNRLGYNESKATHDYNYMYMFVLNEGANQIIKKNYIEAIDSINKAMPKLRSLKNTGNVLAAYYYYGKAYQGLNKFEKAAFNFKKVDSIYQQNREIMTPEFVDGYNFLTKYYKDRGDLEQQIRFLNTYIEINHDLEKNYRELNSAIQRSYDIPHLVDEKQKLINILKERNTKSFWGMGILIISIGAAALYSYTQYKLKKSYRLKFEKLIEKSKPEVLPQKNVMEDKIPIKGKSSAIAEEVVSIILQHLEDFEIQHGFLKPNLTIQSLAREFDSNSKYLSKIVNDYKHKTFIQYINDLRIDYAVSQIQENKIFQRYTQQALAIEFGYNNAESFSAAFYKKTGIKPSFFIKQLQTKS